MLVIVGDSRHWNQSDYALGGLAAHRVVSLTGPIAPGNDPMDPAAVDSTAFLLGVWDPDGRIGRVWLDGLIHLARHDRPVALCVDKHHSLDDIRRTIARHVGDQCAARVALSHNTPYDGFGRTDVFWSRHHYQFVRPDGPIDSGVYGYDVITNWGRVLRYLLAHRAALGGADTHGRQ